MGYYVPMGLIKFLVSPILFFAFPTGGNMRVTKLNIFIIDLFQQFLKNTVRMILF